VIVFVEEKTAVEFNPEDLDLEQGMTLAQLVSTLTEVSSQSRIAIQSTR